MGPVLFFLGILLTTGVIYPLAMTGLAQLMFPGRANGSLVVQNGHVIGSKLIAQSFKNPKYFWPRPPAASASGLDPDLPLELARAQIARIATARRIPPERVAQLIAVNKKPYLNVLMSNIELDALE